MRLMLISLGVLMTGCIQQLPTRSQKFEDCAARFWQLEMSSDAVLQVCGKAHPDRQHDSK